MIDVSRFAALVDARMAQVIQRERENYGGIDPLVDEMFEEVSRLVNAGGKRTRPEFAHLGWVAAGGEPYAQTAVNVGAALELLHVSALIHDDIIDNSDTRRGTPSAHRQFHTLHRENRFAGSAEGYGSSSAILLGDLLLAWADDQFLRTALSLPETDAATFASELRTMRQDVTVGQFLDNHDTRRV